MRLNPTMRVSDERFDFINRATQKTTTILIVSVRVIDVDLVNMLLLLLLSNVFWPV